MQPFLCILQVIITHQFLLFSTYRYTGSLELQQNDNFHWVTSFSNRCHQHAESSALLSSVYFISRVGIYSRRQYKVSVTYHLLTVPYLKKKHLERPYRFILLGVTLYYCYTRSEYRAESSSMSIFLVCLPLLFFPPVCYSAVPLQSIDCFCSSR